MIADALLIKKRGKGAVVLVFAAVGGFCLIGALLGLPSVFSVFVFAAAVFLLYDKTVFLKAFIIITILTANCFISYLVAPLSEHMFGYDSGGYYLFTVLFLVLSYLILFAVSLHSDVIRRIITLFSELTEKSLYIYIIGALLSRLTLKAISVGGVVTVMPLSAVSISDVGYLYYFAAMCAAFWCYSAPFLSLKGIYERMKYKNEAEISSLILENERNYFDKISSQYENMRRYRHDIKYTMSVIKILALSKKTDDIVRYIGEVEEPDIPPRFCDNVAVNALIDDYNNRFAKAETTFDVNTVLPDDFEISSYELCTLLGNLLENAFEAVAQCKRREVNLRIQASGKMLIIRTSNSFSGVVKKDGLKIVSIKETGGGHGLKSVSLIAEKYGGNVSIAYSETDFTVSILIPLKNKYI
jgi:hypothetical protein